MREGEQVRTNGKTETDTRENAKPVQGDIKMDGKKRDIGRGLLEENSAKIHCL